MEKVEHMTRLLKRCVEDGDCLVWTGPVTNEGAPRIYVKGISKSFRRLVWEMREGPIPKGKIVVGTCGRPNCIEHLKLSTKAENLLLSLERPDAAARKALASRNRGRATAKKMSMEKAREVRASSKTLKQLSAEYGIASSLISRIKNNRAWTESPVHPFSGLLK